MGSRSLHDMRELFDDLEQKIGEPRDLSIVLQYIAQAAQQFFKADVCAIFSMNPITGSFSESPTFTGNLLASNDGVLMELSPEELTQHVLKQGIIAVSDTDALPEYQSTFTRIENIRSFIAFPLRTKHREEILGALYVNFRQPRQFNSDEYETFQFFADRISFILQEAWLLHRFQEVASIGQEINHEFSTVKALFQKLQKRLASILDTSHTLLLAVYQSQTNSLDLYLEDEGQLIIKINDPMDGVISHIIRTKETLFIGEMSREVENLPFKRVQIDDSAGKETVLFVPLIFREEALGVLSIQHPQPNVFNDEDLFILQLLANHIALALHNIRLFDNLSSLNEAGQFLVQQLDSEQVLQTISEKIWNAAKADIVVLYPYDPNTELFVGPPLVAGALLEPSLLSISPNSASDIVTLVLSQKKPIFAKENTTLNRMLHNDRRLQPSSFQEREKICSAAALPLWIGDVVVGVLFVNFRQTQRFDAAQKLFLEHLGQFAAIAIRNALMFGKLIQRRAHELEILLKINFELSRNLDLETVLHTLLKLANEHVHAEASSILLPNLRTQVLEIPAAMGYHAEIRKKVVLSLRDMKGMTRWVLEQKKPARADNIQDLPWQTVYVPVTNNMISELDVPLLDNDEVVGILNFESIREGAFKQEDEDFLVTLASQAVLAIKHAQAYEREKRLTVEAQILNQISKEITSQLDTNHIFDLILEKALDLTHSTTGGLLVYNPDRDNLRLVVERGVTKANRGQILDLDQGVVGYVASTRQALTVDPSQLPWSEIYLDFIPGTRSELAVPMLAGTELRGVLNIESSIPDNFNESDTRLLRGLSDLAVVALQNAEHFEKAEKETQRLELLYLASQGLSDITDLTQIDQAYNLVLKIIERYINNHAAIYQSRESKRELTLVYGSLEQVSPRFSKIILNEGLNKQLMQDHQTLVIRDINNLLPDITSELSDSNLNLLVIRPIEFKDRHYGNLALGYPDSFSFQEADLDLFGVLADQLASTIYRMEAARARQDFERRALAAEEMSSIGQSAFELTHRLGNALGPIGMYITSIQDQLNELNTSETSISKDLERIEQSVQAVLSFSRDLKQELAKLGSDDEHVSIAISPKILLADVMRALSVPSNIEVTLDIDEDIAAIQIIPSSISDILSNLIANAIQAMPRGGKITLRAYNVGRSVALEVTDNGVGIPVKMQSQIFDLFFSTKGSSGFGLYSARRNTLKNHGELKVNSVPGQGTTFSLLLPGTE